MTWRELHEVLLVVWNKILRPTDQVPAVPEYAEWPLPDAAEELWADEACRHFAATYQLPPAMTPRQRYVLAPRFRAATIGAQCQKITLADEAAADVSKWLEKLLVQEWSGHGRQEWLDVSRAFARRN